MTHVTYVGTADTRHFTTNDSVGVDLTFARNVPLEVHEDIAEVLLESMADEFIESEAPLELDDSIDDAQEPLPDL